jgi:chemotaxis signal transduction protein
VDVSNKPYKNSEAMMNDPEPLLMEADSSAPLFAAWQDRYLLTVTGAQQLAFPSQWVAEIMVVERSQILSLPFYHPMLLGVVHQRGMIIPLITLSQPQRSGNRSSQFTVIRLNQSVAHLAGVGITVDRVVGTSAQTTEQPQSAHSPLRIFQPTQIPASVWQPRHASQVASPYVTISD